MMRAHTNTDQGAGPRQGSHPTITLCASTNQGSPLHPLPEHNATHFHTGIHKATTKPPPKEQPFSVTMVVAGETTTKNVSKTHVSNDLFTPSQLIFL